ncbi:hypothetical protein AB4Y44_17195 [Paraburkholderia sp. BR10937]|uniref:hypothetical protein n=1 Tax=Paraburkholderia sp. BR10937 TaxID=3236994 RepID=UPI0034D2B392
MTNKKKPPLGLNPEPTVREAAIDLRSQSHTQSLLAKDLGDDTGNAVTEKRKAPPEMSAREVTLLVASHRQIKDELTATREQVESVSNEMARLHALYDASQAEELRLRREMEQMQLERRKTQEANDYLRNELFLVSGSRSALHQQISETERERDAAHREASEMRKQLQKWDPTEARGHLRHIHEQCSRRLTEWRQLDEKIDALKAEEAVIGAKLQERKAALEAFTRVDEQMNALWIDFGEFAQRYHSALRLSAGEGNPERYEAIFGALADVVGKLHMEIVAASQGRRSNMRVRRMRRRGGIGRST